MPGQPVALSQKIGDVDLQYLQYDGQDPPILLLHATGFLPMLPKVACPVFVLEGEESTNRPFVDLKKATAKFQHGTYRLITGAGHLIPMEKPKEIIEFILKHLP